VGDNNTPELAIALYYEGITAQNAHSRRKAGTEEDTGHNDPESTLAVNKWAGHGEEASALGMLPIVSDAPRELLEHPAPTGGETFVQEVSFIAREQRRRRLVVVSDNTAPVALLRPVPCCSLPPPSATCDSKYLASQDCYVARVIGRRRLGGRKLAALMRARISHSIHSSPLGMV